MTLQSILLVILGGATTGLFVLLLAPAFWRRAVRLTTKRLKDSMPLTEAELRADRDRLRAEFATRAFQLEQKAEQGRLASAHHAIELARRDASISEMEHKIRQTGLDIEEARNARFVLEQTVTDRLPRIEKRLEDAKLLITKREQEIAEHVAHGERLQSALDEAAGMHAQQQAEIARLTARLATAGAANAGRGIEREAESETALRSELQALRARVRDQVSMIERLQGRIIDAEEDFGNAPSLATGANSGRQRGRAHVTPEAEIERLRNALYDAKLALEASRTSSPQQRTDPTNERELRRLEALVDGQRGEISRLTAALAAYQEAKEQGAAEHSLSIRESKIALKARLGSAQALAEQQAEVARRLRAELAAANERMARQAQQHTLELRMLGSGRTVGPGDEATGRRGVRGARPHTLADRVERVRAEQSAQPGSAPAPTAAMPTASTNSATGTAAGERSDAAAAVATADPASHTGAMPSPVEPKPAPGGPPRRARLIDRISSLSNS